MTSERITDETAAHWAKLWEEGYEWAVGLRVGSAFLGSYGEAKRRGYQGADANAFHGGATSGLDGWRVIRTQGGTSRICALEAK